MLGIRPPTILTSPRLRTNSKTHADHFDSSKPAIPPRASDLFARLPAQIAHAMTAPGWAKHLAGIDPKSVTSRAALAKLPVLRKSALLGLAEGNAAVRRLQRHAARQGEAAVHVARADLRAGRPRGDYNGARARCSRPAFARATSCTTASRIISRPARFILEAGAHALGCAVIPGGVGNTEAQLDAIAQLKPIGLCRHAGLSEDPARCGRESRQGRVLDQARARLGRGAAALAAQGIGRARRRGEAVLCGRRSRRDLLRERRAAKA